MFRTIFTAIISALIASAGVAFADLGLRDDTAQSIYLRPASVAPPPSSFVGIRSQARMAEIVAQQARRVGVSPTLAVRLATLESRLSERNFVGPKLRQGDRALGVLQVRPGSARALGFDGPSSDLLKPEVGAYWGAMHMKNCEASGARTDDEIAACHVAGPKGWRVKLRRKAEKYKRWYVAKVRSINPIVNFDGWLSRGEGSLNVAGLWRR